MPWEGVFFDAGKREDAAYRFQSAGGRAGRLCQRIFRCGRRHDSLPVSDALPYLIGGAAGGVLAGLLFRKMPARALHLILGGVILAGGIRLIVC